VLAYKLKAIVIDKLPWASVFLHSYYWQLFHPA